jgi:hypothetical protein
MGMTGTILTWLLITLIGVAGFFALGYVQIWLANGKNFSAQGKHTKIIIACVSIGQLPCLVTAFFGIFQLIKAGI